MSNKKLFLSIVSFCDSQLLPTIKDALLQAKSPHNITFSIFEQDIKSNQQEIMDLISSFDAKLIYKYCTVEETQGVVWARHHAAKSLNSDEHDYYLQIDSHTRFSMHYDSFLINSHQHALDYWGPFVWTAYCPGYQIINGEYVLDDSELQSTFAIVHKEFPSILVGCVRPYNHKNLYGETAFQVSGHFLFGPAQIFVDIPFDPFLYWEGEESTYAARLYAQGIKTISPPKVYLWHKYESDLDINPTRKKHSHNEVWQNQKFMEDKIERLSKRGLERCKDFWDNNIEGIYGNCSSEQIHSFLYAEDRSLPEKYATIGFGIEGSPVVR